MARIDAPGRHGHRGRMGYRGDRGARGDAGPEGEPGAPESHNAPGTPPTDGSPGESGKSGRAGSDGGIGETGEPGGTLRLSVLGTDETLQVDGDAQYDNQGKPVVHAEPAIPGQDERGTIQGVIAALIASVRYRC